MSRSRVTGRLSAQVVVWVPLLALAALPAAAQVFVVQPEHVEKRYSEFSPTHVRISTEPMTRLTREELIRFMEREQGFAMRPLPIAVLALRANGAMDPAGEKYIDMLHSRGISAKPGDRVVVTNIQIDRDSILLDLNGGPFHKHRFMRHISIGMDPYNTVPMGGQDDGQQPSGTRMKIEFGKQVPDLTGEQLEELLKPMIDFGVKSPAEAYAETLPDFLAAAIKQHRVLVGMDHDMVTYAKGMPIRKVRETDAQGRPFETWIYGEAPQPVEFVRFIGSYVARVEIAKVGEPILVHASNEMGDYWGNQPVVATNQHEIQLGDRTGQEQTEESKPRAAPTLRQPGDPAPTDDKNNPRPVMAPVHFPTDQQRPGDPGYTPTVSAHPAPQPTASGTASQPTSAQPGAAPGNQQKTSQPPSTAQPGSAQPQSQSAPAQPQN
ncbi:MAG TPA: hypothetical protein VHU89_03995 [Acidobacteriaceae bacterium]|nr:hypothetical protein [Acidobacteriaceae bacterium]